MWKLDCIQAKEMEIILKNDPDEIKRLKEENDFEEYLSGACDDKLEEVLKKEDPETEYSDEDSLINDLTEGMELEEIEKFYREKVGDELVDDAFDTMAIELTDKFEIAIKTEEGKTEQGWSDPKSRIIIAGVEGDMTNTNVIDNYEDFKLFMNLAEVWRNSLNN
jgi:hypothetical protein